MSIKRSLRKDNYSVMSNTGLNEKALSFKATGLLAYLLSKPDNWSISERHLASVKTDGRDSVQSALKELEDAGYVLREKKRNPDGTFSWDSTVYDEPCVAQPWVEKPPVVKPSLVNTPIINTEIFSTELTSTKRESTEGKKNQRATHAATSHPNTFPILQAYGEALGYKPSNFGQEGAAAKRLAEAGYESADVVFAYNTLKAQPFWASKHLSLATVLKELPALAQFVKNGGQPQDVGKRQSKADAGKAAGDRVRQMLMSQDKEDLL